MIRISKDEMIKSSKSSIGDMYDNLSSKKEINIKEIDISTTALVIVDMINGFVREGALKSSRVEDIVPSILALQKFFVEGRGEILAFVDTHTSGAKEFITYPEHCIEGTTESQVLDEIKLISGYREIKKNSTNGFVEEEFKAFLANNNKIKNFIVVGCCTDICVMQLCLTLKNYFNMKNESSRIIVPINCVETFDLSSHNGDVVDMVSLQLMEWAGIQIVSSISL
ncbi:MAG: isochorismatase family cysteine hydrolase [Clostridium sp.]